MPFGFAALSFFIAFFIVLFIPLVVTSPDESDSDLVEEPVVTLGVGPSIFLVAFKRFLNSVTICKLFIAR